jgi:hypothetical protein
MPSALLPSSHGDKAPKFRDDIINHGLEGRGGHFNAAKLLCQGDNPKLQGSPKKYALVDPRVTWRSKTMTGAGEPHELGRAAADVE